MNADRPGAGDQHVLAEHGERKRRVDGVAERVEDGRDVAVDATAVMPDVGHRQRDEFRERAGAVDADAVGVRAEVAAARQAVAAAAADDVALAADEFAGEEVVHVRADLDDLADELVADDHRHRDRASAPTRPSCRCAGRCRRCRCVAHADQHVVDADVGSGTSSSQRPRSATRLTSARIGALSSALRSCSSRTPLVALERELDQAIEQTRVRDPARGEEARVDARLGEAGDRVDLVQDERAVRSQEVVDARHAGEVAGAEGRERGRLDARDGVRLELGRDQDLRAADRVLRLVVVPLAVRADLADRRGHRRLVAEHAALHLAAVEELLGEHLVVSNT